MTNTIRPLKATLDLYTAEEMEKTRTGKGKPLGRIVGDYNDPPVKPGAGIIAALVFR